MSGEEGGAGAVPTILKALFRKLEEIQAEQHRVGLREEETRRLLRSQVEHGLRLERNMERRFSDMDRRFSNLRDDLELMIRSELMGQLGMLRNELDQRFTEITNRLTVLEGGDPWRAPEAGVDL